MSEEKQEGWETAEGSGFIKFDEVGASVAGLLTAHESKTTAKGLANEYTVITKNGTQKFFAPKDLHDKLSGIIIKYGMGNAIIKASFKEKVRTASGNDFKIFEVQHRKKDEATLVELGIDPTGDNF
jgi:hypothetical protein